MIDDDALDLALAALPLEEPPARLHGRIMAATVYRPRMGSIGWETWLIATLVAVALWLGWAVAEAPHFSERITDMISRLVDVGGLDSINTLGWLAVGISTAWWLSQLSIPSRKRFRSQ